MPAASVQHSRRWGVAASRAEAGFGLTRGWGLLKPVMNSHRLVIDRDLVQRDYDSTSSYASDDASKFQLMYQLTRITRDKGALAQDDRLDALAMGVAYFAAAMATDVDKAVARNRDRVRDAELRRFMGHVLGRKPAVPVWASRPA